MTKKVHKGLNKQQEAFCQHYALHRNGAEAYAHAYPKSKSGSAQYRAEKASKMLAQDKIRSRCDALATRVNNIAEEQFDISAERILQEFAAVAFYRVEDYFEWGTDEVPLFQKDGSPMLNSEGEQVSEMRPRLRIKESKSLTRAQLKAVLAASMTISKTGEPVLEVKMGDKLAALKALAQHKKLFQSGLGVKLPDGGGNGAVQIIISPVEADL